MRQIIGRVHRQPQKRTVLVYHILARDTADIILSAQASSKRDMMEAFLSKERGQGNIIFYFRIMISLLTYELELYDLFSGKTIRHQDDPADDEDIENPDEEEGEEESSRLKDKKRKAQEKGKVERKKRAKKEGVDEGVKSGNKAEHEIEGSNTAIPKAATIEERRDHNVGMINDDIYSQIDTSFSHDKSFDTDGTGVTTDYDMDVSDSGALSNISMFSSRRGRSSEASSFISSMSAGECLVFLSSPLLTCYIDFSRPPSPIIQSTPLPAPCMFSSHLSLSAILTITVNVTVCSSSTWGYGTPITGYMRHLITSIILTDPFM